MLKYYALATLLVVGALVVAAQFARPRGEIDVSGGPKTHGTPSLPRVQATVSFPPLGVHGEAPWALAALPECFAQGEEAHGPFAFVRARVPAGMHSVGPSVLDSADCHLRVLAHVAVVTRGSERLVIPQDAEFFAGDRQFALLRRTGKNAELRIYRRADGGPVVFIPGGERSASELWRLH